MTGPDTGGLNEMSIFTWKGLVWIVERDHQPILLDGRGVSFPVTTEGTQAMRAYLNTFPTDEMHYYDAVIYEKLGPK